MMSAIELNFLPSGAIGLFFTIYCLLVYPREMLKSIFLKHGKDKEDIAAYIVTWFLLIMSSWFLANISACIFTNAK
jgi:hypothetical protein